MGVNKAYTKKVRKALGYSATWFPNMPVFPGEIVKLKGYECKHLSTLEDKKIDFKVIQGTGKTEFNYCSGKSVKIIAKGSGEEPPSGAAIQKAKAGFIIKFSRNNAFVLRLSRCSYKMIKDVSSVIKGLVDLAKSGDYDEDSAVVTEAVEAGSATIIICSSSNAQIDLAAAARVKKEELDLADVKAKFNVVGRSDIETELITKEGLTPLFRSIGIKKTFTGKYKEKGFYGILPRQVRFSGVDYSDFD